MNKNLKVNHRDLKPSNILLFNQLLELAKITDFGISKRTDMDGGTINNSGRYMTPNYAAPEIIKMVENSQIDKINEEKSDVYSLGITFCQCLFLKT